MRCEEQSQRLTADIISLLRDAAGKERDVISWTREDYLHELGSVRDALVCSILFAPNFVEVEGFIFLAELAPTSFGSFEELAASIRVAQGKGGDSLTRLLESCNWLEVPYLFADRQGSDEEVVLLAHVVADAWRHRLRGLYPDRSFDVRVLPPGETGGTIGVGFVEVPAS